MIRKMLLSLAFAMAFAGTAIAGGNAEAGKQKSQVCSACHGVDGNSATGDFPRLAGQHEDYLAAALHQYKSGKRKNAIMAGFAGTLSEQDMADLAAYFSSQQGLVIKY